MRAFVMLALLAHSPLVWSQESTGGGSGSSSSGGSNYGAVDDSINMIANTGQKSQTTSTIFNGTASAMYFAGCKAKWDNCVKGAMTAWNAVEANKARRQSGNVADATDSDFNMPTMSDPTLTTPTLGGDPSLPSGSVPGGEGGAGIGGGAGGGTGGGSEIGNLTGRDPNDILRDLADQGYTMNPDGTVTTPTGLKVSPSDLSSPSSMAALGMTPSQIADSLAMDKRVNDAAMKKANAYGAAGGAGGGVGGASVVSMSIDGGMGGGFGRGMAGSFGDDEADRPALSADFGEYLRQLRNPMGAGSKQRAQMLAGKTMSHGADQIGVSVEDIFRMVHRRYQEIRADNQFIEGANAPASGAAKKLVTPKGK